MKRKCCDGHTYKCGTGVGKWLCCLDCPYNVNKPTQFVQFDETNVYKPYLKELGWDEPEYGWTHEKEVLNRLIKLAEQRGYERAKRELQPKYGGQG